MPKEITTSRPCELCNGTAVVYCPSDSAYLCWNCDYAVHSANFLVARHLRSILCSSCGDFDGQDFSGAGIRRIDSFACKSCGRKSQNEEDEVSSISSVCLSTTESSTAGPEVSSVMRRCTVLDRKVEGVLVNWCKRLGVKEDRQDDVVLSTSEVLGVTGFVPVRVALAASFWLGLRFCGDTCRDLKVVEKISGVPGKMILVVEAKLKRVLRTRRRLTCHVDDSKEGWAEC